MECENCKYYVASEFVGGTCHRFPPVVSGGNLFGVYPGVGENFWCGKFKNKTKKNEKGEK